MCFGNKVVFKLQPFIGTTDVNNGAEGRDL